MLKQPIYVEFNLDAKVNNSKLIAISHVDDKYSETLEVAVKQNDRFVYMGGATVIARMVLHRDKDYLLSDNVTCSVNDNGNILIPFDNAVVKTSQGVVKIEVNITRDTDELTLQFPLWVSVNGSILDNAEVTPESKGTIPDLLKDAADALEDATEALDRLGSYDNLEDKPQINGVTLSGNKTSGALRVVGWKTAEIDNCVEDGVLYSTSINNQAAYVLVRNITTDITQYAFFSDGRVMWRTRQAETQWQPAGEWSEWEEIGSKIASGVVNQNGTISFYDADGNLLFTTTGTSVIGPQGAPGNDYVLTAQDKADIAGMVNISGKADKATTLAGYGITDAYTKAEVTALNSAKVDKADYTEVVQEIAEEVGDLKSALDATDADINKLIGNIQCSWKQGKMDGSTGIEHASNSRIITPFIKVKNGDTLQIENPDTSNTLVMSILEFSSNTITSVGVNELIAINYANSTVHSLKLNNSTNYIRLQLNTGDITKGNDMLLYTKDSIVFETIEERNKAIADTNKAIENMSELTLDYPDTGNGYINQNGILVNSDRYYTTGYINATGKLSCIGTIKWLSSDFCYINCYDINKVFLGGVIQGGGSVTYTAPTQITLPNKTAYIRVTKDASAYNNMRFFCADSTTLFSFMPRLADRCLSFIVNSSRSINIKLIGDSITAGLRGTGYNATSTGGGSLIYDNVYQNVEGHCWANSFKAYLEEKFNVSVTNNGVSGIGAGTMINHWNDLVSASDDVVICMIGTNNRASSSSLSEFIGYLEQIVTLANNGNKLLIFMANIPASVANETENKNFHMEDVEHAIRYITDKYNIPFVNVYKLFIEYCINTGVTIDSLLDDGLHPNDAGYDVMFYLICNAFGLATKRPGATW